MEMEYIKSLRGLFIRMKVEGSRFKVQGSGFRVSPRGVPSLDCLQKRGIGFYRFRGFSGVVRRIKI